MYDVCVIGGGIVGKYIASQLRGKKVMWVSSPHPQYISDQSYKIAQYVGTKDTWQEKATGLISWPSRDDIDQFPIPFKQWQKYQNELRSELGIRSLMEVGEAKEYKPVIKYIQAQFPQKPLRYLESAHQTFSGPHFAYREEYDQFWSGKKPKWSFLDLEPEIFRAECFNMDAGRAISIHGYNKKGQRALISAKSFIIACHVPGTVQLLQNTYAAHKIEDEDKNWLGRNFSEHPQMSLGFLCLKHEIPRTTLPAVCYQDYESFGFRFRLEFHFAPPRKELVKSCMRRFPEFTAEHFDKHFMRVVATMHIPNLHGSRIRFRFLDDNHYKISSKFYWFLSLNKQILLDYIQRELLPKTELKLLNQHFPWHFAGHMSGGTALPFVVDDDFFLSTIPNIAIASSSVFPTNGLFNPTMTTLACAKHILSTLTQRI